MLRIFRPLFRRTLWLIMVCFLLLNNSKLLGASQSKVFILDVQSPDRFKLPGRYNLNEKGKREHKNQCGTNEL